MNERTENQAVEWVLLPCNKGGEIVVWKGNYEKIVFRQKPFNCREPALAGGLCGLSATPRGRSRAGRKRSSGEYRAAAATGRSRSRMSRTCSFMGLDTRLLGLARSLGLGGGILGAAAASACCLGGRPLGQTARWLRVD